ncbi:hypothetical protein A2V49_01165 [candidate division WWE3 bacterium RBG_19FT_COMBO_34_6]|uniref:Uncharacterized protein n=1 Tax=candidate division WWE3 bacterium RBG_19FT_COMBO_34_6 TaxID=1802612 RepID=A0A1F4UJR4_UNCKA|nr:MAG: hypothetical protein A2V49_01165 [candidate division WWE3 bacterium RBG_19FT_COMBO_34_6]
MFDILNQVETNISPMFKIFGTNVPNRTYIEWGNVLINIMIGLSFSFSIVGLAMSMVLYVLSGGNPDKTKTAWSAFIYSVIAGCLTVGLVAIRWMIYRVIGYVPDEL